MSTKLERQTELDQSWLVNAGAWTQVVRGGRIASRRLATDAAIHAVILRRQPSRLLDLGCGEGWLARSLAGTSIAVTGIDGSAPLIDLARKAGGSDFHVLGYDEIASDPLRAGQGYGLVVANFSLLQEDLAPLLSGLRACLAPGGALVVQTVHPVSVTPYRDGWRREDFQPLAEFASFQPMPWYFRTLGSWLALLTEAGYRLTVLDEPVHPETGIPLSLILTAEPA